MKHFIRKQKDAQLKRFYSQRTNIVHEKYGDIKLRYLWSYFNAVFIVIITEIGCANSIAWLDTIAGCQNSHVLQTHFKEFFAKTRMLCWKMLCFFIGCHAIFVFHMYHQLNMYSWMVRVLMDKAAQRGAQYSLLFVFVLECLFGNYRIICTLRYYWILLKMPMK